MTNVQKLKLVLIGVLSVATLWVWVSPSATERVKDAHDWYLRPASAFMKVEPMKVQATELHEASHAVVSRVLRGVGSVQWLKVYDLLLPDADGSVTLGRTGANVATRAYSMSDAKNVAAMFFAGGIGERKALELQERSDVTDTLNANATIIAAIQAGAAGDDGATDVVMRQFIETRSAMDCAEAVVDANLEVIGALAELVSEQPVRFGRRFLDEDDLRRFFAEHRVTKPTKVCDF